jgi:peptide/nickel transport system permease protein
MTALIVETRTAEAAPGEPRHRELYATMRNLGPLGGISAIVAIAAALLSIFGPLLAPFPPDAGDLTRSYVGSVGEHVLGFDGQGRDLLSRLLVGARTAMLGPLLVVVVAMLAGTAVGVISAWHGGWLDNLLSAVNDVVFAFPGILLGVLAAATFGPGVTSAALSLGIAYTPYVARIVRGAALRERSMPYVAALQVLGVSTAAICVFHVVGNLRLLLVAEATLLFGWGMLDIAALSFLGIGVQPPHADWGVMVAEAETGVRSGYPAEAIVAGAAIVVVVVAFTILGERLSERRGPR